MPSRTLRSTCTERGSAATCSLKAAIGGVSSTTRPLESVLSATIKPRSLVCVDEHEVEVALELRQRLERRADVERDLRAVRRAVEIALRERRARGIDLARVDAATVTRALG